MSVRERSRLRPQLLERLGWRYMPLWTIEVFTDPPACADRIGGYLGLEKPAGSSRLRPSHGFFDDDIEHLAINHSGAPEGGMLSGARRPGRRGTRPGPRMSARGKQNQA